MSTLYWVVVALTVQTQLFSADDGQQGQNSNQFGQARSLLESAKAIQDTKEKNKQIDRAQQLLEQFVAKRPEDPQSAQANAELAQILLGKARTLILQSESASDADQKSQVRRKARESVGAAREVFQTARDRFEQQYKDFPAFIDRQKDPDEYASRRKVESGLIRAQLNLAFCDFEEAHAYNTIDPKFKTCLARAAAAFEAIHTKYRSLIAGLYARLWWAKCLQETGEVRKALAVCNELRAYPRGTGAIQSLQDRALEFRLICLNDDQLKDYAIVIHEATDWFETVSKRPQPPIGVAIRWELARAQEQRSQQSAVPQSEREQLQHAALENARLIARYAGRFKHKARAMIGRLSAGDE